MPKHELVEAYLEGRLDRRDFVRRLTALGVSAGAATIYAASLSDSAAAAVQGTYGQPGPKLPTVGSGSARATSRKWTTPLVVAGAGAAAFVAGIWRRPKPEV